MIRIRLSRSGVRNRPFYRIVAVDHKLKAKGGGGEVIGTYFPSKKEFKIDKEKYLSWIARGAKASATIEKLLQPKK
jgi:small subunit ribosomal protein S16